MKRTLRYKPSAFVYIASFIAGTVFTSFSFGQNKTAELRQDTDTKSKKSIDIKAIDDILKIEGKENNGEYKVTVPQNDLNVNVDGFDIIPPMGLGSWVAFIPAGGKVMLMGDVVVGGDEIGPVQKTMVDHGLTITAIHNHFVRNQPNYMYMHVGGMGSEEELAKAVKAAFDQIKELRGGDPSKGEAKVVENTLDTKMIEDIIGHKGNTNRGVFKQVIGRPDVNLKDHGYSVSTFAGFNIWASWQGTPERAAVAGDFTMLESEVEHVVKALIKNDIEVVALHNHMVHEKPRIFFLHYWGTGPAEKLAKGLKEALDQTGKEKHKTSKEGH